jgi:hypothetical protein
VQAGSHLPAKDGVAFTLLRFEVEQCDFQLRKSDSSLRNAFNRLCFSCFCYVIRAIPGLPDGIPNFIPKIPIWVYFERPWNFIDWDVLWTICYILWPFGRLCGHLVYLPNIDVFHQDKSGNPEPSAEQQFFPLKSLQCK